MSEAEKERIWIQSKVNFFIQIHALGRGDEPHGGGLVRGRGGNIVLVLVVILLLAVAPEQLLVRVLAAVVVLEQDLVVVLLREGGKQALRGAAVVVVGGLPGEARAQAHKVTAHDVGPEHHQVLHGREAVGAHELLAGADKRLVPQGGAHLGLLRERLVSARRVVMAQPDQRRREGPAQVREHLLAPGRCAPKGREGKRGAQCNGKALNLYPTHQNASSFFFFFFFN
jgi:hypothetical protein